MDFGLSQLGHSLRSFKVHLAPTGQNKIKHKMFAVHLAFTCHQPPKSEACVQGRRGSGSTAASRKTKNVILLSVTVQFESTRPPTSSVFWFSCSWEHQTSIHLRDDHPDLLDSPTSQPHEKKMKKNVPLGAWSRAYTQTHTWYSTQTHMPSAHTHSPSVNESCVTASKDQAHHQQFWEVTAVCCWLDSPSLSFLFWPVSCFPFRISQPLPKTYHLWLRVLLPPPLPSSSSSPSSAHPPACTACTACLRITEQYSHLC